ncbi:MAG: YgjV family protein [Oscillospiraceae bacterium]|nr:YgjV family protein [Oscillospiraceae bacterium]
MNPILIQLVGVLGTVLYFLSYQCKNNRRLFQVQFLSYSFYTAHLLLLGAFTGGFSYILNLVRSFCLGSKNAFLRSRWMCALLCVGQCAVLALTWGGWLSLLPVAGNIASTIGGYTRNARKIRIAGLCINSPLWILYDILVGSWAGILDEVVSDVSMIISIIRFGWNNLDEVQD